MVVWVDADACPVRAEVEKVAGRHRMRVVMVTNGGIRPSSNPLVEMVYVAAGADEADKRIADSVAVGDVVVTSDMPLAAKVVAAGAVAIRPDGSVVNERNVGEALAMRDLMADLRASDPFRQGGGKSFSGADRSRFLDVLDRLVRR